MDIGTWSPSHTILLLVIVVCFVGQIAVLFYRMAQLEKRMDKQTDELRWQNELRRQSDHLENRIGKRIEEVRAEISDVRSEIRSEISNVRTKTSRLNQNHIEHLGYHNHGE